MAAILGAIFFLGVMAAAIWTIVETARPRMGRIAFLLRYGPVIAAELPQPRITVRGRSVPALVSVPVRLREAA